LKLVNNVASHYRRLWSKWSRWSMIDCGASGSTDIKIYGAGFEAGHIAM
jgi:hypothetical protein